MQTSGRVGISPRDFANYLMPVAPFFATLSRKCGSGGTGVKEISGYGVNAEVMQLRQSQRFMMMLGLASLIVGTLIYVTDRPASLVYFVPDSSTLAAQTPTLFGRLGNHLPAYLHVLAFAIFSIAIAGRRHLLLICVGWFVVELIFELFQIDSVAFLIAGVLPAQFGNFVVLENVSSHFITGQFDVVDALFLLLGCGTAFAIGYRVLPCPIDGSRPTRLIGLLFVVMIGVTSIVSSGGTGAA